MKLKSFLLMALAASTTLAACDKSESSGPGPDKMPKSVTVTLPNIAPQVRAIGDAIADESKVELKDFQVFFVKADNTAVDYTGDEPTYFSSETTENFATVATQKHTYHFLPATVTKVVVVGNLGEEKTYDAVKGLTKEVPNDSGSGEGKHPAYPLYGEGDLTEGGDPVPDSEDHKNVYSAVVNLKPRVSRFEIYGFEYKQATAPATNLYTSVKVQKIALNHFYTKYNFVANTPVDEGKVWDNPDQSTAWTWINNRTDWCDDLTDFTLEPGDAKFVDGTTLDETKIDQAKGIITYGLANVANKTNNPELLVALRGTTPAGTEEPFYLHAKFNGDANASVGAFASGKIYRAFFSFDDEDIKQPQRCVQLTVSVASWDVVPVTPEF